jgi:hypothetical protein
MTQVQTLSEQAVEAKKAETLKAQTLRKEVPITHLTLQDEETIYYKDKPIKMHSSAFKGLMRIMGMSRQFIRRFEQLFDPRTKTQFINTVKNAMSKEGTTLTVILTADGKRIAGFSQNALSTVSNETFLGLADRLRNEYNLEVSNWSIDAQTGIISINAFNPHSEIDVLSANEQFNSGLTITNNPFNGVQVMPFVNRLWCANGMTTSISQENINLQDLSKSNMDKFFQKMEHLAHNSFLPSGFKELVSASTHTPASLAEMETAYNLAHEHIGERAESWIPMGQNELQYAQMGYTTKEMAKDQKRRAYTNQSIWSVVNALTHIATHSYQTAENDLVQTKMQVTAGRLFAKPQESNANNWDLAHEMPNPFGANPLQTEEQVGTLLN